MSDVAWDVTVVLLAGALWVVGPVMQWRNIRRLEKLVARLGRSVRHAPRRVKRAGINAVPEVAKPPAPVESLRRANRWTAG
jgi:hypothetical protein